MEVEKYLSRIGFAGSAVQPSLELLRSVHTCHLLAVPFEDLTIHSGGEVRLDLQLIYDKIVNKRRGGFCYENNGLFFWLLTHLGFHVTMMSGQVRNAITQMYGPPFDHLILQGFIAPLSLDTDGLQEEGHRVYRIRRNLEMLVLESQKEENRGEDGEWTEIYKFTLTPRRLEDFIEMCQYHQNSPSSIFVCKSFCTILKPFGRLTYIGRRLITTMFPSEATDGKLEVTTLELKDEEIPEVLAEKFGIVLSSPLIPKMTPSLHQMFSTDHRQCNSITH
ncbi:Arylamine N-acetyltransferase 2 [Oryzias melastigma]|uniref:arylamine N-acetyltransferase n=1 Tax=Oryzias melastigma TaxID=30732 RepID=A0A834C856_ORYME|nr:Arylamine N-acetyltransferase 2 [Oryzias melastigma]